MASRDTLLRRLDAPRSPTMRRRAIRDYGERPTDLTLNTFALLVARGMPAWKAYQRIRPEASDSTASSESSKLLAHPQIRALVRSAVLGLPQLARASAVESIQELHTVAMELEPTDGGLANAKIKALNSLIDRVLPRVSHTVADVRVAFDEVTEVLEAEHVEVADLVLEAPTEAMELVEGAPTKAEQAEDLRAAGKLQREIAEILGCSQSTVHRWLTAGADKVNGS